MMTFSHAFKCSFLHALAGERHCVDAKESHGSRKESLGRRQPKPESESDDLLQLVLWKRKSIFVTLCYKF
jgi:hypothetical protein